MWPVSQERTDMVGQPVKSAVWGNVEYAVTQDFGVLGFRPDWYDYSKYHGFPPGYHIGLDVGTPKGTPVFANAYATVKQAGFSDSFRPNPVTLETMDDPRTSENEAGFTEIYGHLWSDAVSAGQTVRPGDLIGYTGEQTVKGTMTPDGSGAHIHFEVYDSQSNAINPLPFLGAKFTPNPNAPNAGSGNQYSYPGQGIVDCVKDPKGCAEIQGFKDAVGDIAARSGIMFVGLLLLAVGLFAVVNGENVGRFAKAMV